MEEKTVSLADAKAHLSELTELAAAGESVVITKRGRPVARITQPARMRQPIDLQVLRTLTASLPPQDEEAGTFVRQMRDSARY